MKKSCSARFFSRFTSNNRGREVANGVFLVLDGSLQTNHSQERSSKLLCLLACHVNNFGRTLASFGVFVFATTTYTHLSRMLEGNTLELSLG